MKATTEEFKEHSLHDVIIVGAGAAGLGTAYYLRDSGLDVLVVESGQDIGGRSHTVKLAGTSANSGAMFVYKGTKSEELVHELGIETVPFLPETYGIHVNGKTGNTGKVLEPAWPSQKLTCLAALSFRRSVSRLKVRQRVSSQADMTS